MLVKVQRSIETSEECPQMLVYNYRRSKMGQFDLTQEWLDRFGSLDSREYWKFFCEVDWGDQRQMPRFVKRVGWCNW